MHSRALRHIELIELAERLRLYAESLQADVNAAFLLVHQTLAAAFHVAPRRRKGETLEAVLRRDIEQRFNARRPGQSIIGIGKRHG